MELIGLENIMQIKGEGKMNVSNLFDTYKMTICKSDVKRFDIMN